MQVSKFYFSLIAAVRKDYLSPFMVYFFLPSDLVKLQRFIDLYSSFQKSYLTSRLRQTANWIKLKFVFCQKSGPARGFGYTVSWAFLIQVYGIFWSKFGYKVFSFS